MGSGLNGAKIRLISFLIVILILIIIVANEAIMIRSKIMIKMALELILVPFGSGLDMLRDLGPAWVEPLKTRFICLSVPPALITSIY